MHYSYYKRPLLLLLVLYVALLSCFYRPAPSSDDVYHKIPLKTVALTGKVVSFPVLKKNGYNAVVKVLAVNGEKTGGYVYARFKEYTPAWHETLQLQGRLKKPYSIAMLGNFDWGAYLATQHVSTEMAVSSAQQKAPPSFFFRAIAAVRADILKVFEQNFPRNLAAIAGGVLLGERGEIDGGLYSDFQDSGAIHLLVASGGNVGFVTLIVFAFCALFGAGRKKTVVLALVIAGVYTLIAGADAPLVRAYFMTVCAVTGYLLHRNSGVFQGLIISCFVILLFNPACVFETGFEMSFLATLAIIVCLNTYQLPAAWPRWVKFFVQIFMATLCTQLVLLPVFTNVFFKVSFAGLLSNMLLVPLASLLMGLSFAYYVFSLLHMGFVLHALTQGTLWTFEQLVRFFASFPFSSVTAAAWRPGWIVSYYTGLFLLFNLPQKIFVRRIWKYALAVMVLAPAVQYLFFNPPTVWLLNEWNKNAVLVRLPNGSRLLFGAAIDGDKLSRAVLRSGGTQLDAVFISEDAAKQTKEIKELQKQITVKKVVLPFADVWPGEEITVRGTQVRAEWGLLKNRQGALWRNRGYSGGRDSLSYTVTDKDLSFTVSANGRFIEHNGVTFDNKRNATQTLHL